MKIQIIVTVIAALCAGVLGAVIVNPGDSTVNSPDDTPQIEALTVRLDQLEQQNEDLLRRLSSVENRPILDPAPVRAPADQLEAIDTSDLTELVASLRDPEVRLPENFRQEIGNVLQDIRDREEKEKEEARETRRQERFDERLAQLAKDLNMTPYQTEEMRIALVDMEKKFDATREQIRENGDWTTMRESMTKIRDEMQQTLAGFLSPEQLTKYNESQSNMFGFGRRGRGGPDGGGGGGRGGQQRGGG